MTSSRRTDVFSQDLQYERAHKDRFSHACFAAFSSALATVNFGYALGYTAEAEFSDSFRSQTKAIPFDSRQNHPLEKDGDFEDCNGFDMFASVIALGALIGGILAGYLIDKIGRKATIISTSLFYTSGWLLITFNKCYKWDHKMICPSYGKHTSIILLYLGRVLTGVGVGISSLAVPVYISEVSSARFRGALGNINQLSINFGFFLAYIIGFKIDLPYTAFVPICISFLNIVLMVAFVPETPRWLLVNNKRHDALLALYWLRGSDYPVEEECFEIETGVNFGNEEKWEFKDLKEPKFYWPLIISSFLMFFQEFSGINCILFFCSSLFGKAGIGGNGTNTTDIIKDAKTDALYVCCTLLVFTVISCFLVDRVGRRKLLLTGSIGMFVSLFFIGLYCKVYPIGSHDNPTQHNVYAKLALFCTLLFIAMFAVGWGPLPWLLMSEMFPIKTRAVATSIVTATNWLLVFTTTSSFCYMIKSPLQPSGTFWFFAACTLFGFFFTLFLVPETKGRPLEDVSELFIRRRILQVNLPWQRYDSL